MARQDRLSAWETLFRRALQAIDTVAEPALKPANWSFGGGTVLMRRYRHRLSKDIDIFVPDPQYLGYLDPELNDGVQALTSRHLREAGYLRLYFPDGEVDFIAAGPVTEKPSVLETVLDRRVNVETSIEIVAKKIRYRAAGFTARDVFDFALVTKKHPRDASKIRPLLREQRETLLERLASGDKILRTAFAALDVLDYRPSYDECLAILKSALEKA